MKRYFNGQQNMVSAFNPSLSRSGQPTPDSELVPWSRVLTGDRLKYVLMVGETGAPGGNPREHANHYACRRQDMMQEVC